MAEKEVGVSSRGILSNPLTGREARANNTQEGILYGFWGHGRGDIIGNQDHYKTGYNPAVPRVDLPISWGDNPKGWVRKCRKLLKPHFVFAHRRTEVASFTWMCKQRF